MSVFSVHKFFIDDNNTFYLSVDSHPVNLNQTHRKVSANKKPSKLSLAKRNTIKNVGNTQSCVKNVDKKGKTP
jgi:hypothetical protein